MSYGKVTPRKGYTEAVFYKTAFDEMLRRGQYEDSSIVLRELKSKGYLDCEADRYTRSRKSQSGIIQDVYILRLDEAVMQQLDSEHKNQGDEKNE